MANEMTPPNAISDLIGAFKPLAWRRLENEIRARIARVPSELNGYGYDHYGMHPEDVVRVALPGSLLYQRYFKVETHDIDRVPAGRVLLIANHAGQLPFDAMMLGMAMLLEAEPPRICRGMAEYWVSELPFVNVVATRMGSMVGTPRNCVSMLENDECVMVFPEGVRGMNKTWKERYRLQRFGTGFMRLALQTGTPIVPVGIVGSEEQQPGEGFFDPDTYDPRVQMIDTLPLFRQTLAKAGLEDTVLPMVGRSAVFARFWSIPLGLVFIDGGHSYAAAVGDYTGWAGHIMPGGFLMIHDIFASPEQGGQAPRHVYKLALASGLFRELPMTKTLGVLQRRSPEDAAGNLPE